LNNCVKTIDYIDKNLLLYRYILVLIRIQNNSLFAININFTIKMAKEIERKFLVKGEFRHLAINNIQITQTYLSVDPQKTIRLRISDNKAFLTIKSPVGKESFSRNEWEYIIPIEDAKEIMQLCLPGKIVKTRYLISSGKHAFEVDVFHDKNEGLVIAEIELSSENEHFEIPDWLGEEVTGRSEYYNSNLIK
jgi:adenylate cyclase